MAATPQNDTEQLVAIFAAEIQALETAIEEILNEAHTDPADTNIIGEQLDGIGEILDLLRQGLSDAIYRARLSTRILVIRSSGTPEDVIGVARAFTAVGGCVFTYNEDDHHPAGFEIEFTDPLPELGCGSQFALAIRAARPAGVNGYVEFHETTPVFAFDGAGSAKFDGGYNMGTALG